MQLPLASQAIVPEEKITRYLLNPTHPVGGSKAAFFLRFGFSQDRLRELAAALLRHAAENEVVATEQTRHGTRYVVDGPMGAPDGSRLNVRTPWYIGIGGGAPRFVTAHPLRRT